MKRVSEHRYDSLEVGSFAARLASIWSIVTRTLRRLRVPVADREDIEQQTFVELWIRRAELATLESAKLACYARRTALSIFIKTVRASRCHEAVDRGLAVIRDVSPPAPDDLVEWHETVRRRLALVDELCEPYRTVLRMCDVEGKSVNAVAAELGLPAGTVKTRLRTARRLHGELCVGAGA